MNPTPASSPGAARETDAVGEPAGSEPTGNGPAVNPATGIAPAGQPLTQLGGSTEYLEHLEDGADHTAAGGERALRRRPLDHEEYHALVQDRMRDLDALEVDGGARLAPGHRLLVALDVDGTILDIDGRVSERMMASLARLRAHGVRIVISTGRGIEAALPVAHHLGLTDGWMICANGAITLRMDPAAPGGYEVADSVVFDPTDVIATLSRAVPDGILAVEVLDGGFEVSRPFPDGELIEAQRVVSLEEMAAQPVTRVVLRAPGMDVGEFSDLVAGCGLHSVEYAIGWTAWLDVAPEGVTKASALQALAARLGTDASRTIAVGDGTNDVEMLRWAGLGAAMGSAPESVKESSDIVTEAVWHDGCAALLDAVVERTRKRSQS